MAKRPSPDELRKLKEKATEAAAKGKFDKAAELFREVAEGDPRDVAVRQKLAESLRRAGRMPEAIEAYREVADRFARDGLLIKAIAISKSILELDPQHVETQNALAELYAQRARAEGARPPARTMVVQALKAVPAQPPPRPRDTDAVVALALGAPAAQAPPPLPPPPRPRPQPAFEAPAPPPRRAPLAETATPLAQIVGAAQAAVEAGTLEDLLIEADPVDAAVIEDEPLAAPPVEAAAPPEEGLEIVVEPELPAPEPAAPAPAPAASPSAPVPPPSPAALPRIPIFSDVSREAFLALTAGMVLHRVAPGEAVIREGEEGTSFYVVASGKLSVSKRDEAAGRLVLAHLGDGDFFGEMALLSGAPRSATVAAELESEVLELRAESLLEIAGRHPHVAQSLRKFYRQRLLANALAVSPIFRPFQRGDRKLIMERFRAREVVEGEVVVREGTPSDGLYVVLEGAVDVVKARDGAQVAVGHLREGDLFGEMSCLRKAPASATVVVARAGTLLRLPRREFDELVVTYPQILELVATLSEERAENLDAILSGHAEWTEEGLVLT